MSKKIKIKNYIKALKIIFYINLAISLTLIVFIIYKFNNDKQYFANIISQSIKQEEVLKSLENKLELCHQNFENIEKEKNIMQFKLYKATKKLEENQEMVFNFLYPNGIDDIDIKVADDDEKLQNQDNNLNTN